MIPHVENAGAPQCNHSLKHSTWYNSLSYINHKPKNNPKTKIRLNAPKFLILHYFLFQNLLVLSPLQNPITSPVSPTQSRTPLTTAFAIPWFVPLLALPFLSPPTLSGSLPALIKLLPSPVAYSDPILGKTFSPADSDTKSANGTSQTQRPK